MPSIKSKAETKSQAETTKIFVVSVEDSYGGMIPRGAFRTELAALTFVRLEKEKEDGWVLTEIYPMELK